MAGKAEYIGTVKGKKIFLDLRETLTLSDNKKIPNPNYKKVVWKVPDIRESIRAEAGYKILSADYSQIEVRLMAYLSGDPWLIAAINSGKDVHCFFAVDTFGEELEFDYDTIKAAAKDEEHPRYEELSAVRSDIKQVVFGTPYGATAVRIAFITGKSLEEAAALIDRYFAKAKVLKIWLDKQGDDAIYKGYSISPKGRKRFYILPHRDDPERERILAQIRRYASNQPIQGGNVDMLKPAMAMIYEEFRLRNWSYEDARILFVVHDEIVCTARIELANEVQEIMTRCMQKAYDDIIPNIINKITVSIDDRWKKD